MQRLTRKSYNRFITKWDGSSGNLAFPRNKDVLKAVLMALPSTMYIISLLLRNKLDIVHMGVFNWAILIALIPLSGVLIWKAFLMHRHYDKYNKSLKVFKKKHDLSEKAIINLKSDVASGEALFSDDKVKTIEGEELIVVKVDYYYRRVILTDNRMHTFKELTKI